MAKRGHNGDRHSGQDQHNSGSRRHSFATGSAIAKFLAPGGVPSVTAQVARDKRRKHTSAEGKDHGHRRTNSRPHHQPSNTEEPGPRPHHHHHRRHSTRSVEVKPLAAMPLAVAYFEVAIWDLDHRFTKAFRFRVLPGCTVQKLRHKLWERDVGTKNNPVPSHGEISLYNLRGEPVGDDEVVVDEEKMWFRVDEPSSNTTTSQRTTSHATTWIFTHYHNETHRRLEPKLNDGLARAIETGATFRDLRRKIASYINIDNPNRIKLRQENGMQRCLSMTNSWEVAQVKKIWLCNWLSIDVAEENHFVILRGLGREYIYHKICRKEDVMNVEHLTQWVKDELVGSVLLGRYENFDLTRKDVTLRKSGNLIRHPSTIIWGATYDFELPADAAEFFSVNEAKFLPENETCAVCSHVKKRSDFPVHITAQCEHKPNLCKGCLTLWIHSQMDDSEWNKLKCPECPELLQFEDVKRYASPDVFAKYDHLAFRSVVKNFENFHWCLAPGCESGQITDEGCIKFTCGRDKCKASHCIRHNVPWHKHETCDQYDKRNKQRHKDEKASEEVIKTTSKKCPGCDRTVHKFDGCNHISCTCRHEWCYICLAPFEKTETGFLYCRHKSNCTESSDLYDMVRNGMGNHGYRERAWEVTPGLDGAEGAIRDPMPRDLIGRSPIPPQFGEMPLRPGQPGFGPHDTMMRPHQNGEIPPRGDQFDVFGPQDLGEPVFRQARVMSWVPDTFNNLPPPLYSQLLPGPGPIEPGGPAIQPPGPGHFPGLPPGLGLPGPEPEMPSGPPPGPRLGPHTTPYPADFFTPRPGPINHWLDQTEQIPPPQPPDNMGMSTYHPRHIQHPLRPTSMHSSLNTPMPPYLQRNPLRFGWEQSHISPPFRPPVFMPRTPANFHRPWQNRHNQHPTGPRDLHGQQHTGVDDFSDMVMNNYHAGYMPQNTMTRMTAANGSQDNFHSYREPTNMMSDTDSDGSPRLRNHFRPR